MPQPTDSGPTPGVPPEQGRRLSFRELYDAMIAHLKRSGTGPRALGQGDELPEFILPTWDGRLIGREALLSRGPAIISFVRGHWCPHCRGEMEGLREHQAGIMAAGGTLVVVSPEVGGRAATMRRDMALECEVLCDVDAGFALACGLVFRVPDDLQTAYLGAGHDIPQRYGNDGWLLPIPATYVVDRRGIVRFAHVDEDFRNRPDPRLLIEALSELG